MITVRLKGGLGNQMFQYAVGRALGKRAHTPMELDISWYKESKNRRFELNQLNIPRDIRIETRKRRWFDYIKDYVSGISERYDYGEKDLLGIESLLRNEFTLRLPLSPKAADWMKKISSAESVAVHIRRGDYLWEKHQNIYGLLPTAYYEKAAALILEKKTDVRFFVFSDDGAWVKENLKLPAMFDVVSDGTLISAEEMMLMSAAKHQIIANSTFSWWAAWLNRNNNKIVIAPLKWFADRTRSASDIVPQSWIRL